jgi:hemerythrin-like domain-containing protein
MKCLETLTAEHKTILRIADVLESMARKATDDAELNNQDVEGIFQLLRKFGDELHQAKEEGSLFPVFSALCNPSEYASVRHMVFEHAQDRSLMSGMADAIARSNAFQFGEYAARLAEMLRNHIYKEDNILFEAIRTHLSADDDARIVGEFTEYDREFRAHDGEKLLDGLRHLEWKYLRKIA